MPDNMCGLGKSQDELMAVANELKTLVKLREDAIFQEKVKNANEQATAPKTFTKIQ